MKAKANIKPTIEGSCPYCKKRVKSLQNHIKDQHKNEKLLKKK